MASNNNQHAAPAAGVWTELRQRAKRESGSTITRCSLCSAVVGSLEEKATWQLCAFQNDKRQAKLINRHT